MPNSANAKTKSPVPKNRPPIFKKLYDNSPQGILIHNNFRPLYANKAFATLLEFRSPKDIMAMPILRPLFSPDMWARIEHDYDDIVNQRKKSAPVQMPLLQKSGKEIWVAGTLNGVHWNGTPAVEISVFDISAQVAVERSLLRAEQHFRSVLEILPYPIYIASSETGKLLFVNRKTCLLFQRSASSLLRGTSVDFFVNAKEREDLRKLFETMNDARDIEVQMKTSTGREFPAELSAIRMEYNGTPATLVALNDISERKALEDQLEHLASTDSLTEIGNRRYFMTQAEQEISRSRRFKRDLSVMMLDIDHFKPINDRYGHAVGDAVLQGVVRRASESLRLTDQIARLGGEEFAVLLPETDLKSAIKGAKRLREHLADNPIVVGGKAIHCTVSIGVAELKDEDKTIDDLMRRADEAMYRAKEAGRNRVEQAE